MNGPINVLIGLIGCGGLAGISFLIASYFGKKSDILKAVHKVTQKNKEEKINQIEQKQTIVKVKIDKSEKVSEQAKTKIKEIQKEAVIEIEKILTEEKISNIHKSIEEDWEEI